MGKSQYNPTGSLLRSAAETAFAASGRITQKILLGRPCIHRKYTIPVSRGCYHSLRSTAKAIFLPGNWLLLYGRIPTAQQTGCNHRSQQLPDRETCSLNRERYFDRYTTGPNKDERIRFFSKADAVHSARESNGSTSFFTYFKGALRRHKFPSCCKKEIKRSPN